MDTKGFAGKATHWAIGGVGGVALAAFLGFGSGWVTTHSRMTEAVAEARVSTLAAVCTGEAVVSWKEQKRDLAALRKIDAWDTREKLAKQVAADLPTGHDKDLEGRVAGRCASELMTAAR